MTDETNEIHRMLGRLEALLESSTLRGEQRAGHIERSIEDRFKSFDNLKADRNDLLQLRNDIHKLMTDAVSDQNERFSDRMNSLSSALRKVEKKIEDDSILSNANATALREDVISMRETLESDAAARAAAPHQFLARVTSAFRVIYYVLLVALIVSILFAKGFGGVREIMPMLRQMGG